MDEQAKQAWRDEEHLRLLSLGFYIFAGVDALLALFGLLYVFMGTVMALMITHLPMKHGEAPPPEMFKWLFALIGGALFFMWASMAVLKFLSARFIKQRRSRTFCLVAAVLGAWQFPSGTVLAVLAFVVLLRPSIVAMFAQRG